MTEASVNGSGSAGAGPEVRDSKSVNLFHGSSILWPVVVVVVFVLFSVLFYFFEPIISAVNCIWLITLTDKKWFCGEVNTTEKQM